MCQEYPKLVLKREAVHFNKDYKKLLEYKLNKFVSTVKKEINKLLHPKPKMTEVEKLLLREVLPSYWFDPNYESIFISKEEKSDEEISYEKYKKIGNLIREYSSNELNYHLLNRAETSAPWGEDTITYLRNEFLRKREEILNEKETNK